MSRDIIEENRIGQRGQHVSWIWRLDDGLMDEQSALLTESKHLSLSSILSCFLHDIYFLVTHINWLCARARHQRWEEEIVIVKHEMVWTQLWFGHQVQMWETRRSNAFFAMSKGHEVYAAKQVWVWNQFLNDAKKCFSTLMDV
jgi:hypothetical protein